MLYERSVIVLPTLYFCPVENVLGPGSSAVDSLLLEWQHMQYHTAQVQGSLGAIPAEAAADSRQDSGTGSRLFEINIWMWRYGRTFPREIVVANAVELRKKRLIDSRTRAAATLKRRREAQLIAREGYDV